MNTNELLMLIDKLTSTGYKHIDLSHEGSRVLLSNAEAPVGQGVIGFTGSGGSSNTVSTGTVTPSDVSGNTMTISPLNEQSAGVKETIVDSVSHEKSEISRSKELVGHLVESPIVGTFYSASGPDAEDYVKVGDKVSKGDVLCIIEAMKLMNEIEADADGEIAEILVQNEAGVEFGQPLFRIV